MSKMSKSNGKKSAPSVSKATNQSSKSAASPLQKETSKQESTAQNIEIIQLPVPIEINLRAIDKAISEDIHSKWPLIIDPNDRVSAFLRHRDANIIVGMDMQHMKGEYVRGQLINALRYGKVFVIGNFKFSKN
jgi:hypothetical protein